MVSCGPKEYPGSTYEDLANTHFVDEEEIYLLSLMSTLKDTWKHFLFDVRQTC